MKHLFILFLLFLFCQQISSQSLEGDWKGKFVTTQIGPIPAPSSISEKPTAISLRFLLNKDSSYSVYSFTKGLNSKRQDTIVICKVTGVFSKDSIYLVEVELVEPRGIPSCFQKMALKIWKRKKITELDGTWKSEPGNCVSAGTIHFWKKNE